MFIEPMRYILAPERLQGPVVTALPGCRAITLPLKREVTPTLIVARLLAATSVGIENAMRRRAHMFCPYVPTPKNLVLKSGHRVRLE